MENLIQKINKLKKEKVSELVSKRIKEFEENGKNENKIFSELCFCLLTANFQAEKSIKIQEKLRRDFEVLSREELAKKLKEEGHRFWPQRAECIVLAREKRKNILEILKEKNGKNAREKIVKEVKGLGMKEASHFLRNIGYKNVAIIDFHIVDLLVDEKLIERPKTITSKRYLEIEKILEELGRKVDLDLAELDLYLWYLETGKVLK